MISLRRLRIAWLVLVLAVLGACSDGATSASRDSEASWPEFVNGGDCEPHPSEALPAGTGCVTALRGDADGDEAPDTLLVYALVGDDLRPRSWRIRLESGSGTITQRLEAGSKFSYPRAIAAADVDGDGRDEWFVKVLDLAGHGAAWQTLNLFVLDDERLTPLSYEGAPLAMNVGGISRLGEGIKCERERLVLLRAEAQNRLNTRWSFSARSFLVEDSRFTRRRTGTLTISDYNDPDLDPFFSLDCGGSHYTP